jgi:hypothetical protein
MSIERNSSRLRTALGLGVLFWAIARITVFWRGGVGGIVSVSFFHLFAAAFAVAAIRYLVRGTNVREKNRWVWGLAALISFELGVVTSDAARGVRGVFSALTLICIVALIVLGIATAIRRIRGVTA